MIHAYKFAPLVHDDRWVCASR